MTLDKSPYEIVINPNGEKEVQYLFDFVSQVERRPAGAHCFSDEHFYYRSYRKENLDFIK